MKIVSIQAYPLYASFERLFGGADKVPPSMLAPASHFRLIPRSGQHSTVVLVKSDTGHTGIGEAFGLPHAQPTASLVEGVIAPALLGQTVSEPGKLLADLYSFFVALGHTRGPAIEALSGVDIALWDLLAKQAGLPLAEHLGATLGPVPTYVSPVPYLDSAPQSADRARAFVAQGFKGVKLKIGRGLATDLEHISAVREAIGSHTRLMLDANCAYGVDDAIALAAALKPFDVAWLEEPIRPDSPDELAQVRRRSPVPIACGENEFMLSSFEALARAGAVDFLQPNITRAGGVSGMLEIDRICTRYGVALSPHGVGSGIGVAAAVHTARAAKAFSVYEANLLPNALRSELPVEPMAIVDGQLIPTRRPGHGCETNWEVLASYDIRGTAARAA
jgi:D-galactarolactone cycloisomerase